MENEKPEKNGINLIGVEQKTLIGTAVMALGSFLIWRSWPIFWGIVVGGEISWFNFRLLRLIVTGAFQRKGRQRVFLIILYPLKYLGLLALVFLLMRLKYFHPLAFLAGLSVILLGLLAQVIAESFEQNGKETDSL